MFGVAIGAPLTGFAIDHLGPGWGFATAGAAGLVLALVALLLARVAGSPRPVTHEELASSKV
jgi:predicted MFS family arabinose efflux permease